MGCASMKIWSCPSDLLGKVNKLNTIFIDYYDDGSKNKIRFSEVQLGFSHTSTQER